MIRTPRLANAISKAFPTADVTLAQRTIEWYRRSRNQGGTDWEDQRSTFQRIIRISFKYRHLNFGNK